MVIGAEGVAPWGRGREGADDVGVEVESTEAGGAGWEMAAASPEAATATAAAGRRVLPDDAELEEALAADVAEEVEDAEVDAFEVWAIPVPELWEAEWEPEWLLVLLLDDVFEVDFFLVPDELLF